MSEPMICTREEFQRMRAEIERLKAKRLAIKASLDTRLNNYLCKMKPNYDDSITGFNEAWDIMRKYFAEAEPPSMEKDKG